MSDSPSTTYLEYKRSLTERHATYAALCKRDATLANARLLLFIAAVILAIVLVRAGVENIVWLMVPVLLFGALMVAHDRVLRKKHQARRAVQFYERGMTRLEDRWAGTGVVSREQMPPNHPYAEDLDIFGEGSLFELMCTVRTYMGEATLAKWLCEAADPETIVRRQAAVQELEPNSALRETLGTLGEDVRSGMGSEKLVAWATAAPILRPGEPVQLLAKVLAVIAALYIAACVLWGWPISLLAVIAVVDILLLRFMKKRLELVASPLDRTVRDLQLLGKVAAVLESHTFTSALLIETQQRLVTSQASASHSIARLSRIVEWMDAQRNQLFFPIALLVLWPIHFAYALEKWRHQHGDSVQDWFDAVGELEALCALSMYAHEHPADPFPVLDESGTRYDGVDLGHPLLAPDTCVTNSVSLDSQNKLIMVSGSNMSGKSTLLRVVGINAVLAFAGAPVRATSLTLSPLRVAASLHITDSIQKGTSHFYAEILRLKVMLELTGEKSPVLFLIDEMLHGTNSHDRQAGSQAVLQSLVRNGAIGLVTTHDLALTQIAETMEGAARNVHFQDHLEGGELVFDYRMHQGVVQKSNALSLMRSIGLDV